MALNESIVPVHVVRLPGTALLANRSDGVAPKGYCTRALMRRASGPSKPQAAIHGVRCFVAEGRTGQAALYA